MKNLGYLFWAYTLIWLGIFLYLVRLSTLQRRIQERIRRIREQLERSPRP